MRDVEFVFSSTCNLSVIVQDEMEPSELSLQLHLGSDTRAHATYTRNLDLPATYEMCRQELVALLQEAGVESLYPEDSEKFTEALDYIWGCLPETEHAGEEGIYTKSISRPPLNCPPPRVSRRRR